MNYHKITIFTLIASVVFLALMVPGGPVETRSFANVNSIIVMGFNIFLTLLSIVSIVAIYFMFKRQKWAYQLTGVLGFAYMLVFVLDLGKIFPVSPNPMNMTLLVLEWISLILGGMLILFSYKTISTTEKNYWSGIFHIPISFIVIIILLLLLGGGIVYFATRSALI